MSDLTADDRRLIAKILRDVAPLTETVGEDVLNALALKVEIDRLSEEIRDLREATERRMRDTLVEQTRTLVKMADSLSASLGHSVALLDAIDEAKLTQAVPSLSGAVEAGRDAIQAWHQAKPHIARGLAVMDEP